MPVYSVTIEGADFPPRLLEGAKGPLGFFAARIVECESSKAAEAAAVELIKAELKPLLGERCDGEPSPTMYLDQISELDRLPEDVVNSGMTWFQMGS
ncbi:hypothetical protein EH30_00535 [Erythrobacter sp. JL475]|nr:hypothetical protein EH30_00535 [Erythrobacter sp. JL475]